MSVLRHVASGHSCALRSVGKSGKWFHRAFSVCPSCTSRSHHQSYPSEGICEEALEGAACLQAWLQTSSLSISMTLRGTLWPLRSKWNLPWLPQFPKTQESDRLQLCPAPPPHTPDTLMNQQAGQWGEVFIIRESLGYRKGRLDVESKDRG